MAQFSSDQITNVTAVPKVELRPADSAGRIRIMRGTYTTAGDASGSVWFMGVIPWNARVLLSVLTNDALTGAVTATLDDKVTAGRWGTATSMAAAGSQVLSPTTADGALAVPTVQPANSTIAGCPPGYLPVCLTTAAAAVTGAQKIHLRVFYVVD